MTSRTCATHRAGSRSTGPSRRTTSTASGARSTTTTGRRSISPTLQGRIRYHHFGEGEYAATEMAIQQLLMDAGAAGRRPEPGHGRAAGARGTGRLALRAISRNIRRLRPGEWLCQRGRRGVRPAARLRTVLTRPQPVVTGRQLDAARSAGIANEPAAKIAFRFHARDLNLVMAPSARGAALPFRVTLDGDQLGDSHGDDAAADGTGTLNDQRTYQLIRQSGPITDRTAEIEFLAAGAEAYCFTFG